MCPHHIPEVAQRELLEDQNDQIAERLSGKMATLHNIAIGIREETTSQNDYMSKNSDIFDTARALLGGSFARVQQMNKQTSTNCKIMCYFTLFAIVLFFFVYFFYDWIVGSSSN
jgi:hypothetical protein